MPTRADLPGVSLSERKLIVDLLSQAHLPSGTTVVAFGSRVEGGFRPNSDLDLLFQAPKSFDLALLGALRLAFEESDLPYAVDLLEEKRLDPTIRDSILRLKRAHLYSSP